MFFTVQIFMLHHKVKYFHGCPLLNHSTLIALAIRESMSQTGLFGINLESYMLYNFLLYQSVMFSFQFVHFLVSYEIEDDVDQEVAKLLTPTVARWIAEKVRTAHFGLMHHLEKE